MLRAEPIIPSHVVLGRIFLARLVRSAAIHARQLGGTMEPACLAMGWESDRRAASRRRCCNGSIPATSLIRSKRGSSMGWPAHQDRGVARHRYCSNSVRFSRRITGKMKQWPSFLSIN
ncbi:hypothetical protein VPH35_115117 [Triticum aestivum]